MTTNGNGKRPLPDGWTLTKLGDVLTFIGSGITPRGGKSVYQNQGVKFLRSQNVYPGELRLEDVAHVSPKLHQKMSRTHVQDGDVLLNITGASIGRSATVPQGFGPANVNQHVCILRLPNSIVPSFLSWYLNSPHGQDWIMGTQSGVTRQGLNYGQIREMVFPLPSLPVQERIVAEIEKQFTRLDTAVSTLNRLQTNLDRYQASLLKAACTGQLLPQDPNDEPADRLLQRILAERRQRWLEAEWQNQIERAQKKAAQAQRKAAGRPHYIRDLDPADWQAIPEAEYAPYLPQNDKWQKKYKEPAAVETADLPDLPSGWVWANIGYLFDVKVGSTPSRRKEKYWNGDIPWVSSGEVAFAHIKETEETITKAGLDNSSVQLNPPGTVLLAMIGEGKTRGQAAILDVAATNNQNACAILCADSVIPSEWVFYWLMARYEETRSGGSGGMQPALNSQLVKALLIPVAPLNEMRQIVEEIESKLSIVTATQQAISANLTRSGRLRQSILQQAFNGRLV
jgi:type I restriction enzyme, S subunit